MQEFSQQEWDKFYEILQFLGKHPFDSPDNDRLKGLVTKIYKTAKKDIKQTAANDRRAVSLNAIEKTAVFRQARQSSVNEAPENVIALPLQQTVPNAIVCYACRKQYTQLHQHYHRLCPECADIHLEKKAQRLDLQNRTAIVTGARMKIGYVTTLKLLRDGATVIATTRFAADALLSYSKEPDFNTWKHRLFIYSLDLISIPQVEMFLQYVQENFSSLDIIINNAAQTISYPAAYYKPLIDKQFQLSTITAEDQSRILANPMVSAPLKLETNEALLAAHTFFPAHKTDFFDQPLDLRDSNSWTMKLEEVDTAEVLSANLVNNIAPFMLNSRLKPMLMNSPFRDKYIINVSSSEGQFSYEGKTIFHPHTNMTKAALNMMTRTSGRDYAGDGIYMNSVDVGWVSTGNPIEKRTRLEEKGIIPPLMLDDAAARIYDPLYRGMQGEKLAGKLFKDYIEVSW
ncbi:Enoyl-(Acyl carrier protein) reductase [Chitinophaga sp. YR627]|uniref:SDR family NAD(P)-dependent oxidoreductase n=1 Tax=Chitinophaga sp. YR627 TaxID=1881041 RepID=UPI0008E0D231|nr:SDR family oxidoreductase [Chitinophaga sp. YR627]SFO21419.1 Enoyl-(Acyl carrier protein) reductase [Chitinophaga sp. YR627]